MDLSSIRNEVEILRDTNRLIRELEERQKAARAAVEEVMGEEEIGELDGHAVIIWLHYKISRFDIKSFREHNPELYEEYRQAREQRRMEIR